MCYYKRTLICLIIKTSGLSIDLNFFPEEKVFSHLTICGNFVLTLNTFFNVNSLICDF